MRIQALGGLLAALIICGAPSPVLRAADLPDGASFPPAPWTDDLEAAQKAAAASGKGVLVCFTILNFCAVCRKFDEHFLSQESFTAPLTDSFELVWIDTRSGQEDEDSPTFQLRQEYEVIAFPSVLLTEAGGRPYAVTGFRPGGIQSYLAHLERLREAQKIRTRTLELAADADGLRRAELLAATIPELAPPRTARFYEQRLREILELDPDRTLESTRRAHDQLADFAYIESMRELDRDLRWSEMVTLTNEYIENEALSGSRKQAALMNRFEVHEQQSDGMAMLRTLHEITRVNPYNRHGRDAQTMLDLLIAEFEEQALLELPPSFP